MKLKKTCVIQRSKNLNFITIQISGKKCNFFKTSNDTIFFMRNDTVFIVYPSPLLGIFVYVSA